MFNLDEAAAARIRELESALQETVDYLDRLPAHPLTRCHSERLQEVLVNKNPLLTPEWKTGESFTPSGVPLLRVEVQGNVALISAIAGREFDSYVRAVLRKGNHSVQLRDKL